MNDIQIKCVIEAARSGSFLEAAERMYLTPPTFGRHISTLEEELGFPLFVRGRMLRLTPAGEVVYKGFQEIQTRMETILHEAERLHAGKSGSLTIGILEGQIVDDKLRSTLFSMRKTYPELEIEMSRYSFRRLEELLLSGKLDVGITLTQEIRYVESLESVVFQRLKNYLVLPKEHPLARKDNVTLADFADTPLLELDGGECVHVSKTMNEHCRAAGFEPRLVHYSDLQSQLMALEAGMGMMALNGNHIACHNPNLVAKELDGLPEAEFCSAWNRDNHNPAIQLFLERVQ